MSLSDYFRLAALIGTSIGLLAAIGLFFSTRISERKKNETIQMLQADLEGKKQQISKLESFKTSIEPGMAFLSDNPTETHNSFVRTLRFGSKFPTAIPYYELLLKTSKPFVEATYKTVGQINTSDGITRIVNDPVTGELQIKGTNLAPNCVVEITISSGKSFEIVECNLPMNNLH